MWWFMCCQIHHTSYLSFELTSHFPFVFDWQTILPRVVLENCPKKCPEGTNEECGAGEQCFDLTGNEPMICKTEGFGVKKKADPTKRFCGDTYNQMMEFVSVTICCST